MSALLWGALALIFLAVVRADAQHATAHHFAGASQPAKTQPPALPRVAGHPAGGPPADGARSGPPARARATFYSGGGHER